MLAHMVSPPASGTATARRIEPSGGSRSNVTSLCQRSATTGRRASLSSTTISGWP